MKKSLLALLAVSAALLIGLELTASERIPLTILAPGRAQFEYNARTIQFDFEGAKPVDTAKIYAIKKVGDENLVVGTIIQMKQVAVGFAPKEEYIDLFILIFDKNWKLAAKPVIIDLFRYAAHIRDFWIGIEGNKILTVYVFSDNTLDFHEHDLAGKTIQFEQKSLIQKIDLPLPRNAEEMQEYQEKMRENDRKAPYIEKIAGVKIKKGKVVVKLNTTKEGKAGTAKVEFDIK